MKKAAATILSILLILPLASCGKEETPHALYQAAVEKTQALESYEMELEMEMKMTAEGMTVEIPMKLNIRIARKDGEQVRRILSETQVMGEKIAGDAYFEGEYTYYTSPDGNYKIKTEEDEDSFGPLTDITVTQLDEAFSPDVRMTEDDDGNRSFTLSLTADQLPDAFGEIIESMTEENIIADVTDITLTAVIAPDGYFSSFAVRFKMPMEMSGTEINTDFSVVCRYVDPGKPVTVEAPDGYRDYREKSASSDPDETDELPSV